MAYNVAATRFFLKELKNLAKKYPSIANDLNQLIEKLEEEPTMGDGIGKHCYKIRMAITSKGRGKSAGARVITLIQIIDEQVLLLSIYDKSEKDTISEKELQNILDGLK